MTLYYRPLAQVGPGQPDDAVPLAGGWAWFTQVEILSRSVPSRVVPAQVLPPRTLAALTAPALRLAGLAWTDRA